MPAQYRAKGKRFYTIMARTRVAPRICHGKIAVTDARRGAEREATDRAFMMDIKGHWI
jgi:hypothetical protein